MEVTNLVCRFRMNGAISTIDFHYMYRDIFVVPLRCFVIAQFQVVWSFPVALKTVEPTVLTVTYVSIIMHRILIT
jgi:hypothetical protein